MSLKEKLIELLNREDYTAIMTEMYSSIKVCLNEELRKIDDETMVSYLKAYCVYCCDNKSSARLQELYLFSLNMGFALVGVLSEFVDQMNAMTAKIAEPVNKERIDDLERLLKYKDDNIYKELSKSDKTITQMIKKVGCYITIKELKKGTYQKRDNYTISEEEIKAIEKVKQHPELNQLAHSLYDEKTAYSYKPNHEIKDDDDILKKFLIYTNKNNPQYNIVFNDGTIVNYFEGEIRVKPYKMQHILLFTKLFYAANHNSMKKFYMIIDNVADTDFSEPSKLGAELLVSSISNVLIILRSLEEIYTKKMIDNSKEMFVKLKKITKEYDL